MDGAERKSERGLDLRHELATTGLRRFLFIVPAIAAAAALAAPALAAGAGWSTPVQIDTTLFPESGSCASATFCATVGTSGAVGGAASFDGQSWSSPATIDASATDGFGAVSCPTASFCAIKVGPRVIREK